MVPKPRTVGVELQAIKQTECSFCLAGLEQPAQRPETPHLPGPDGALLSGL